MSTEDSNPTPSNNNNTSPQYANTNNIQNIQNNQGNQAHPLQQIQMQSAPVGNFQMNQQVLPNSMTNHYAGMNHQMPIQIQPPMATHIPNSNQIIPANSAHNINYNSNPGYLIHQNLGNNQLPNIIQNNQQQLIPNPLNNQQQIPIGNHHRDLQSVVSQITPEPYSVYYIPQDPNLMNSNYQFEQRKFIDRKNLFSRYYSLCKYDYANMERTYKYLDAFVSSIHVIALAAIFFNKKYESRLYGSGYKHILKAFGFLFANYYLNSSYNNYFIRRSFEIKYKDVDDENLESIIKSLEAYKVKVLH